ncbi:MAG: crotonase [Alcaligenaceae bacterium]|nr:crotonase [Alcaligenaceae bacterium]
MSEYTQIHFEIRDTIATITLNRPDALNALTFDLMAELRRAVETVNQDTRARALILTGAGRGFCSGQDLKNRLPDGADLVGTLMEAYYPGIEALRQCRVPTLAAVNGVAAGAGFSLALACDFIIAAQSARFIQAFSRIGLVPDLGATYTLPRAIGRSRALRLMMTGEPLSAATAEAWGLTAQTVEDAQLLDAARHWLQPLVNGPTQALRKTRELVNASEENSFEAQCRLELEFQQMLRAQHDAKEGGAAFLEKRKPVFKDA